jgi:zinc protease
VALMVRWSRRQFLTASAALAATVAVGHRSRAAAQSGVVQSTVLPNGLTVLTRARPGAETAAVAVAVLAGSRDESPGLRGGSHWLEHIHFLGTSGFPTTEALYNTISEVGGDLNASTSTETTTYYVTVPAARLSVALNVLSEMLQRPTFDEDAVERERGVVQEELRGSRESALRTALLTVNQRLNGAAGQDPAATVAEVGRIDRANLLAYRGARYTAGNMAVAVVGPVAHADVVTLVTRALGGLAPGTPGARPALTPAPGAVRLDGETPFESIVMVGQRIPGLGSPDAPALQVFDAVLDVPGTRMIDALTDARVAGEGGTSIQLFSDVGLWAGYAVAPPSRAERVVPVLKDAVRRLQDEGPNATEVGEAATYLAGRTLLAAETVAAQAQRLATHTLLGVYYTEEAWAARLAAVTPADVRRVAASYFDPDAFAVLVQR